MALQIPNIYTLGQIQVSTQPLAQLQGKLLAEQQAKEEAIDKYYEKQLSSLDKQGIAENDVANYEKRVSDLGNYWKENRNEIRKGGTAKMNFDKLVQDQKNFIYESKRKANENFEMAKLFKVGGKPMTDNDIFVMERQYLPLGDPNRINPKTGRAYGMADLSPKIPLFDLSKKNKFFGDVSMGIEPSIREKEIDPNTKKPLLRTEGTEKFYRTFIKYSDDEIKKMESKLALGFKADDSASNHYETIWSNPKDPENAETIKRLNDAWQSVPWHRGTEMQSPLDLAKAELFFEKYNKPVDIEKLDYEPKPAQPKVGAKDKWQDYYFLESYPTVDVNFKGETKKGVLAANIKPDNRATLKKMDIEPFYDKNTGLDFYIYEGAGKWKGVGPYGEQTITEDDVAQASAPSEVKREEKGKKSIKNKY